MIKILTYALDKTQKTKSIIDLYNLLKENNEVELFTLKNNSSNQAIKIKNIFELSKILKNSEDTVITNSLFISDLLGKKGKSKNKVYYISEYINDTDVKNMIKKTKKVDNIITPLKSNYVLLNKKVKPRLTYIYDIIKEKKVVHDGLIPLFFCTSVDSYKNAIKVIKKLNLKEVNIICNFDSIIKNSEYNIYYNLSEKVLKNTSIFVSMDINIRLYILEAYSYKIPVIAYNDEELKEVVSNNWDGYLVENEDRLIKKIHDLLNNESRKIIMSNNAIKKSDKFNYLIVKEKWRKIVEYERNNN